jgi:sulfur carrier protein ThiS
MQEFSRESFFSQAGKHAPNARVPEKPGKSLGSPRIRWVSATLVGGSNMRRNRGESWLKLATIAVPFLFLVFGVNGGQAGQRTSGYQVLAPITHGNLTIFPVLAGSGRAHDTRNFLTLDEGVRSGEVVVTEAGRIAGLVRRRSPVPFNERRIPLPTGGAQVNQLVLVNNSDRPLILLAGEIVTGGKQDRVVGKDRIVPPKSDPIALDVFCVEPHRWVEKAATFKSFNSQMAQPSVRRRAMANKDQQAVWDEVGRSKAGIIAAMPPPSPATARALESTSSYAIIMASPEVKAHVDSVAAPVERSYENLIHELRARNAVGVVVAVNGEIIWADVFANTSLLEKYWPKLIRSYAAEAMSTRVEGVNLNQADAKTAQAFLEDLQGRREKVESEPGVYRNTEILGDGFTVLELAALLPSTGFDIHIAKMAE